MINALLAIALAEARKSHAEESEWPEPPAQRQTRKRKMREARRGAGERTG